MSSFILGSGGFEVPRSKSEERGINVADKGFQKKQYSLPTAAVEKIEQLKDPVGTKSDSEIVKLSIGIFWFLVQHILAGHEIVILKRTGDREERETISLPFIAR